MSSNVSVRNRTDVDNLLNRCLAYLCATSGVLSSASSDQLRIVVLQEFFVETHMLLLREDGIIVLEAIFFEQGFITITFR